MLCDRCTLSDDNLKATLKVAYLFLLKRFSKIIKPKHLTEGKDADAAEIVKFVEVLELNQNTIFGSAEYKMLEKRQAVLKRPVNLPPDQEVLKLSDFLLLKISHIASNKFNLWNSSSYSELRDLVLCRLTLWNARRGGEPARLTLEHWTDAKDSGWLNEASLSRLDQMYRKLFTDLKVVYQSGKGKCFVPVLFPKDSIEAMNILTDPVVREAAGVATSNRYIFPHTKGSSLHVSGWHAVNRMCVASGVSDPSLVTATKMRHRVSTIFVSKEVCEKDRDLFYRHMGHSKKMNEDVYQAPLVEQEVLRIGAQLAHIDQCKHLSYVNDPYLLIICVPIIGTGGYIKGQCPFI